MTRSQKIVRALIAVVVVLVIALGFGFVELKKAYDTIEAGSATNKGAAETLAGQLEEEGVEPKIDVDTLPDPGASPQAQQVIRESVPAARLLQAAREAVEGVLGSVCGGDGCTDGEDSDVPGPPGRPPTAEEVLQAVSAFCEVRNACTPPAPADGTDGADAPRITSSRCNADDQIVLGFNTGPDVVVEGSDCRVDQPEPEPTPEPTELVP